MNTLHWDTIPKAYNNFLLLFKGGCNNSKDLICWWNLTTWTNKIVYLQNIKDKVFWGEENWRFGNPFVLKAIYTILLTQEWSGGF